LGQKSAKFEKPYVDGVSIKEYETNKKSSNELNSFVNEDFNID